MVLPKLINKVQTGFMTNRYIGDNIRLIYDSLVNAELFNIPGMLFLIDFENAFDSVSWSFIDNTLYNVLALEITLEEGFKYFKRILHLV